MLMGGREYGAKRRAAKCCVAGGGPAGMMVAYLLARAGVDVVVLEKHKDFLRDFRGDTIHPSTLDLMYELGLLDDFLKLPHQELTELQAQIGDGVFKIADFTHLPTHCKFLVLMPQWDFLNFLADRARQCPSFEVKMQAEVTGLIEEDGRIRGVRAKTPEGDLEVRADLTIAADGRHSNVREHAGLTVDTLGAPMDVLFFRLSRKPSDPAQTFGRADAGRILILLDREDYWQIGFVIPKGDADATKKKGLDSFRAELARLCHFLSDRVGELREWDDIKVLSVAVDRLRTWSRAGLLCIGDAAHAMSPIGGVGINLAIQDAVATANLLAPKLKAGVPDVHDLAAVEARRIFPTKATQQLQIAIQNKVIVHVLGATKQINAPWAVRLLDHSPVLQRIPARVIGIGFRPEHVRNGQQPR